MGCYKVREKERKGKNCRGRSERVVKRGDRRKGRRKIEVTGLLKVEREGKEGERK